MADSTQRDQVKNHLEAARDWLGSASGALEKREDIKSELDIMLAEAELTRAREMKNSPAGEKGLRRRAKLLRQGMKIAPLLAALAIAALWLRFSAVTPPIKPTPPTPPVVARPVVPPVNQVKQQTGEQPETPAAEKPSGYAASPPAAEGEKQSEEKPAAPAPAEVTEGKRPPENAEGMENMEGSESPADDGSSQPESSPGTLPDSSTQQMMLDAAKILRRMK